MKRKSASRARALMPEQVIEYLTYALEDVNVLSPRSAYPLAHAIALLTEDTLWKAEAIRRTRRGTPLH